MIKKSNDLREGVTRCDCCSQIATVITDRGAFCSRHATQKTASVNETPLKGVAVPLTDLHRKG